MWISRVTWGYTNSLDGTVQSYYYLLQIGTENAAFMYITLDQNDWRRRKWSSNWALSRYLKVGSLEVGKWRRFSCQCPTESLVL